MPERSNGAVLKTVGRASASWVRIPPPPLVVIVTISGSRSEVVETLVSSSRAQADAQATAHGYLERT